ncbi:aspartate carbamoyltransferase [Anoxybacter fermentans]|uniref:Aspartate carbamoyltransferase n=1 Tax=Anoxybacter fermentans TaxID=1323375 RepID=A0A3S9SXI9_9FIRM|nr:aspartate carbamoyltransferase catalytic subunit [Anoxybacter fermentans]AZR73011.1 aspartate carbamoyltransferase [Anoxybacter fermentans]
MSRLKRKHLLGLADVSKEEISLILDTAEAMKEVFTRKVKKVPTLTGKTVVSFFFEPSTRTKASFDLAGKMLSANMLSLSGSSSSVAKGESLIDTGKTLEAMGADIIVIRHSAPGAPHLLARYVNASIINAGDGAHEHPTQALLDMFTIKEKKGRIEGLNVLIVGDILHSRVARSNIFGLKTMGANVRVVGPATLIPKDLKNLGVEVYYSLDEALKGADVVNILRIQRERQKKGLFPSIREYHRFYGMNERIISLLKDDVLILHPGPMNQGVEIDPIIALDDRAVIEEQVTNGVAVRMALFYLLAGRGNQNEKIN